MNEAQVLGFADGNTSIPISWMVSNGLFLGIAFNGSALFESTTSSTAPYQVSIRLDGTEIAISPVITSGAAAGVYVPNSFENDTGTFTAHIISDSNITFQSLKWKLSLFLQPNYLVPGTFVEAEYTSTDLSYTSSNSVVLATGNYRQQTIGNLGAVTACASCVVAPSVVTTTVTNITGTTAASGGETITDGGGTISAKGIQWSADNFATQMGATSQGDGTTADFASTITGLTAGSTYYVRAFVTNELTTSFGAVLTFAANVSVPCSSSVSAGGPGITDLSVSLDSAGGLIAFALNAYGVADKLEIIHGTASGTKKATTGWTASGNFGTPGFDNTYGTEPLNTIPTTAQGNANAYFIGTQAINPAPLRTTEFNNDTGRTATLGSYQQIVWWPYTTADYQANSQATIRVTGATGTQWQLLRICCPDSNCT